MGGHRAGGLPSLRLDSPLLAAVLVVVVAVLTLFVRPHFRRHRIHARMMRDAAAAVPDPAGSVSRAPCPSRNRCVHVPRPALDVATEMKNALTAAAEDHAVQLCTIERFLPSGRAVNLCRIMVTTRTYFRFREVRHGVVIDVRTHVSGSGTEAAPDGSDVDIRAF
ncbi:MAG TPA: hypothetical protein VNQ77_07715 [Frankiaceae bacterium]|nr:hypothetical protein [Frankiaceae bacterium]